MDYCRPEVVKLAVLMEQKLRENDHKPGWKDDPVEYLMQRVYDEVAELWDEVHTTTPTYDSTKIARESADVANMAMMVADVVGGLDPVDICHVRQHVEPGDPQDLQTKALQWYLRYEFGYPHSVRESNIAVEAFKDGYRAAKDDAMMWSTIAGDYAMGLEEIRDATWSEVPDADPPVRRIRNTAHYWLEEGSKTFKNYNA